MLRAMLLGPGVLDVVETPMPEPGADGIVVRIEAALTCGTDVKTWRRGHPKIPLPSAFGHEFTGTVAAAGRDVRTFREGDAVACTPTAPCFACGPCLRGRTNLCDTAIAEMVFGAFGEYVRVPGRVVRTNTFMRPATMSAITAAALEPLSCVIHGAARVDLAAAERVLIIGDGPIGLLFARVARLQGAGTVVLAGHHSARLDVGGDYGAEVTTAGPAELRERFSGEKGADIVIECVGKPELWTLAHDLTRPGGVALLHGGCAGGTAVAFDSFRMHYQEVDAMGAFHYRPEDVRAAFDLLAAGRVDIGALVTHTVPLARFAEGFALAVDRTAIKVAILP
jgi:L-iditol 2-dehydrogenase